MSVAKGRINHAKAILGPELHSRLANTSVLLVGAGGIGCELRRLARLQRRVDQLTVFHHDRRQSRTLS
jgi:tRNA A37 threonylcarbamoyladenosine dehydratase